MQLVSLIFGLIFITPIVISILLWKASGLIGNNTEREDIVLQTDNLDNENFYLIYIVCATFNLNSKYIICSTSKVYIRCMHTIYKSNKLYNCFIFCIILVCVFFNNKFYVIDSFYLFICIKLYYFLSNTQYFHIYFEKQTNALVFVKIF